jgi:uncharacterized protein YbjT (DUF2867 family)
MSATGSLKEMADIQPAQRVALVAGATGLTGSGLLPVLLAGLDYSRVYAITRRPLLLDHARLANRVLSFEQLPAKLAGTRVHDAFCCLGAPGGRAADPAQLRAVDLALTLGFARAAQALGATRFVVISAAGADSAASHPFLRVKGEMEAALRELRFPALDVLQPGAVLGLRPQASVAGLLELALRPVLNPLLHGRLAPRRAIMATELAAAMAGAARAARGGVHLYAGPSLRALALAGHRAA